MSVALMYVTHTTQWPIINASSGEIKQARRNDVKDTRMFTERERRDAANINKDFCNYKVKDKYKYRALFRNLLYKYL